MGASNKKSDNELVKVETDVLRERLNRLFQNRSNQGYHLGKPGGAGSESIFEHLWDLKEKALLDRKATVEVPQTWLDSLEQEQSDRRH